MRPISCYRKLIKFLKTFDKIIFFGIGGSQLGPLLLGEALISDFHEKVVMITGSDPEEFSEKLLT